MPYIAADKRDVFKEPIESAIKTIMINSAPHMTKAEYFAYFVLRICENYMGCVLSTNAFNSSTFNSGHKKQLEDLAVRIVSKTNRSAPLESVGGLNYVISKTWWGICGDHPEVEEAKYGFRCLLRGVIEQYLSTLNLVKFESNTSPADAVMNMRRAISIRGMLCDVISETYRRKTQVYEDAMIEKNGDLW